MSSAVSGPPALVKELTRAALDLQPALCDDALAKGRSFDQGGKKERARR
jgi:hypothetical protein